MPYTPIKETKFSDVIARIKAELKDPNAPKLRPEDIRRAQLMGGMIVTKRKPK